MKESYIVIICLFTLFFTFWVTAPSEKDLKQCMRITGQTKEQCQVTLTR